MRNLWINGLHDNVIGYTANKFQKATINKNFFIMQKKQLIK